MNCKYLIVWSALLPVVVAACGDSAGGVDTLDRVETDTATEDTSDSVETDTQSEDTSDTSDTAEETTPDASACEAVGEPCSTGVPGACSTGVGVCVDGAFACAPPDGDGDGLFDCLDGCPENPSLFIATVCGCGDLVDTDTDGVFDCADGCPSDPAKAAPGACGCGLADTDEDLDGLADCVEVSTCADGLECGANERCELLVSGPACVCNDGYTGAPCEDIDECELGEVCGALRDCVNIAGAFECPCKAGFREDGAGACVDLDECDSSPTPCGPAHCINRYGTWECGCDPLTNCDVTYTCEADSNCTDCNSEDTRICRACRPGFSPQPLLGIESLLSCESTNECLTLNPIPTARHIGPYLDRIEQLVCVDTPTSYTLTCRAGFVLDETVSPAVCRDIDECALPTTSCSPEPTSAFERKSDCINLAGSFRCVCPAGWTQAASGICQDVNECEANRCSFYPCTNEPGDFVCSCQQGLEGDPRTTGCFPPVDPAQTRCEGFGWYMAAAGEQARFRCYYIDRLGKKRLPLDNQLSITVTGPAGPLTVTPTPRINALEVVYVPPTAGSYDIVVRMNGQQVGEVRQVEAAATGGCVSNPFDYLAECRTPVTVSGTSSQVNLQIANLPDTRLFTLGRVVKALSYDEQRGLYEVELIREDGTRFGAINLAATRANFLVGAVAHRLCLGTGETQEGSAGAGCSLFALSASAGISGDGSSLLDPSPYPTHVEHVLLGNRSNRTIVGDYVVWSWEVASNPFFAQFNNDYIVGGPMASRLCGDVDAAFVGVAANPVFGDDEIVANGPSQLYGDCKSLRLAQGNVTRPIELGNDVLIGSDGPDELYGDFAEGMASGGTAGPTMLGGQDTLRGGAGDDLLYGDGVPGQPFPHDASDVLEGGPGDDIIVGTTVTLGRTAGDTYVFDLSDPRGFGDDTLVSAARGTFGNVGDTLRFVGVPDVDGDSTATVADLYPLTKAVAVGFYVRIEVYADLAQTQRLGSFYLPYVAFFHPTLQGYPFRLELR